MSSQLDEALVARGVCAHRNCGWCAPEPWVVRAWACEGMGLCCVVLCCVVLCCVVLCCVVLCCVVLCCVVLCCVVLCCVVLCCVVLCCVVLCCVVLCCVVLCCVVLCCVVLCCVVVCCGVLCCVVLCCVVLCCVVLCCVVLCCVVLCCVVLCCVVLCCAVLCCVVLCCPVEHVTTQHNTTQHNTTQHNTAQHSTAQHSTAQHSTAQHSTAQHSLWPPHQMRALPCPCPHMSLSPRHPSLASEGGRSLRKGLPPPTPAHQTLFHALVCAPWHLCAQAWAQVWRPWRAGGGGRTYGGRPGQRVEEQGTWASRTQNHSEAGYGRPVDRGACTAKTVKRPGNNQHNPQYANYWAPLTRKRHIPPHSAQPRHTDDGAPRTRKRHQQEHRPQRPTERSDPTRHAKGRTGDCPGPRKGATTRRNVTQGAD